MKYKNKDEHTQTMEDIIYALAIVPMVLFLVWFACISKADQKDTNTTPHKRVNKQSDEKSSVSIEERIRRRKKVLY